MLRENPGIRAVMKADGPKWDSQMAQPVTVESSRRLLRCAMYVKTPQQQWSAQLCYMTYRVRGYQLTDKRDTIYAILDLVKKAIPLETLEPFPVKVDYTASVEDAYTSITSMLINEISVLTALSLVGDIAFRTTYPGLPSWFLNYSYPFCPITLAWLGVGAYFNTSDTQSTETPSPSMAANSPPLAKSALPNGK
jgi:hypothetical protein